jgi:hypothetical protein
MLAASGSRLALRARLFGLVLGSFALFWFSGQMASQAISGLDDWQIAADWPLELRLAAVSVGILVYVGTVFLVWRLAKLLGPGTSRWRRFLAPYAAGALALVACASLRPNDGSALETVRAVGLAPLGYLWAVTRPTVGQGTGTEVARSWPWIVVGLVGLAFYGATLGLGLGRMA